MPLDRVHLYWCDAVGREGARGDAGTLVPYWSFTKTALAICALKLVEDGQLELDRRLDGEAFTLRQLLDHTAGLPDYGALPEYARAVSDDEEPWSRERLLATALRDGPLFTPGAGWTYSNVGYLVVRDFVEAASGLAFAELVREVVAKPLGLASLRLATTRAQFAQVAWPDARRYHPGWVYHGCLVGDARDAARLLHGLMDGRLLDRASLTEMTRPRRVGGALEERPWTDCGYGLGLMIGEMSPLGRAVGHTGGGPFSVGAVYHFPDAPKPVTISAFGPGVDVGAVEKVVASLAAERLSADHQTTTDLTDAP